MAPRPMICAALLVFVGVVLRIVKRRLGYWLFGWSWYSLAAIAATGLGGYLYLCGLPGARRKR